MEINGKGRSVGSVVGRKGFRWKLEKGKLWRKDIMMAKVYAEEREREGWRNNKMLALICTDEGKANGAEELYLVILTVLILLRR